MTRLRLMTLVVALAAATAMFPATSVGAQAIYPDECYDIEYETVTGNFNGFPVEQDQEVSRELREECIVPPDNRINAQDAYAAASIYCTATGVSVWDIDDLSRGTFSFLVPYAQIDAVTATDSAVLIEEHNGFRLYRLTSGELQLNSPADWEGKEYVFSWGGCTPPAA